MARVYNQSEYVQVHVRKCVHEHVQVRKCVQVHVHLQVQVCVQAHSPVRRAQGTVARWPIIYDMMTCTAGGVAAP